MQDNRVCTIVDCRWRNSPGNLTLGENEVHVWRASLDLPEPAVQKMHLTLSAEEKRKAERFRFRQDRERAVITQGILRAILSRYTGVEPGELRFCYSPYGKPALGCNGDIAATDRGRGSSGQIRFNLSHSRGLVLYAVTRGREVGIDLEWIRAGFEDEQIAEQFFSRREVAALRSLAHDLQAEAFFNCWTRKEAYVKARGEGLMVPLDQFDVSLAPGEPASLLSTSGDPLEAARWSMEALSPGSGYAAALVVEGHSWQLVCWQWTP